MLKQVCRFALLNPNIHNTPDPTPVDFDHDAHAWALSLFTRHIITTHLFSLARDDFASSPSMEFSIHHSWYYIFIYDVY